MDKFNAIDSGELDTYTQRERQREMLTHECDYMKWVRKTIVHLVLCRMQTHNTSFWMSVFVSPNLYILVCHIQKIKLVWIWRMAKNQNELHSREGYLHGMMLEPHYSTEYIERIGINSRYNKHTQHNSLDTPINRFFFISLISLNQAIVALCIDLPTKMFNLSWRNVFYYCRLTFTRVFASKRKPKVSLQNLQQINPTSTTIKRKISNQPLIIHCETFIAHIILINKAFSGQIYLNHTITLFDLRLQNRS